jgi:tRNA dimethylallyltransferase
MNPLLICIVGPTAVGKTDLGIKVAKNLNTEIISADSRQIYKGMSIGTAAPTEKECQEAKHHFVNFLDPSETYSAGDFEREATLFLSEFFKTHKVAVMVGGSGLYVKGIVDGFDHLPTDETTRKELNDRVESNGLHSLAEELSILDPEMASNMDLHNTQRVVRALEVCLSSGKPMTSFLNNTSTERNFDILQVGLEMPRAELQHRIALRTQMMIDAGWVAETEGLTSFSQHNSLRTVGYNELFAYLRKECSLEEAQEKIVIKTRQFAKKQMTWFKKDERVVWFESKNENEALEYCLEFASKYE